MIEPRHQDHDPAPTKDTDQAHTRGAPLAALHAKGYRHVQQCAVGDRGVAQAADAQQPQGGDRDG